MTVKLLKILGISSILFLTSGCSTVGKFLFPPEIKTVEKVVTVTKTEKIEIKQPLLPRAIDLKDPKFYVVSEAVIPNPCLRDENGKRDCSLGKENDWKEGYTYFDRFVDDMKKVNGGDLVFVAMAINDYELMAVNMQEIKRYINQLGEVIVYYRTMTMKGSDDETNPNKPEEQTDTK